jgi:flagellar hook-length control protein FliK
MFFSDQGIMGLKSQVTIFRAQGELNIEKQTGSLFQEDVPDGKTFLNYLFQAAGQRKISAQSANGKEESPIQKEQPSEVLLNFLGSDLKLDNLDYALEISTGANMFHLIETADNIPCYADIPELNTMIPGQPGELIYGNKESGMQPFLLKAIKFTTDNKVPGHLELAPGAGFKFEALENQERAMPDTGKDNRQALRTFLEQVLLASKNTHEVLSPEINSTKAPVLKAFESQTPVRQLAEEPPAGADLRKWLDSFANESKNKPVLENERSDSALNAFAKQDEKIINSGKIFKNITVGHLEGNLQVRKESGQTISNPAFQTLSTLEIQETTNNPNSPIKQAAMIFDKDSYRVESTVLGQVVTRLFTGVRRGSQNMTIYLYPPELGRVKVRIVSDKGDLNVRLHSVNHQVAGILEKYLPILQQSLEDQGIVLSGLQVGVESGNQEGSQFEENEFNFVAQEIPMNKLSEDDQDALTVGENPEWYGSSSIGLNLIV